jgi:hypothetical protein
MEDNKVMVVVRKRDNTIWKLTRRDLKALIKFLRDESACELDDIYDCRCDWVADLVDELDTEDFYDIIGHWYEERAGRTETAWVCGKTDKQVLCELWDEV